MQVSLVSVPTYLVHDTQVRNDNAMETLEIIKTNGKKPKIAHIGFIYHFQKECSNFLRWRCSKFSSLKCPSVLKTSLNIENPTFVGLDHDHVHHSNKNAVAALKLQNIMKTKAQKSHATPSQIFAESVINVPHAVLSELPKEEHVKRTIRKNRGYNDPSKPASRNELVIEGIYIFIIYCYKLYVKIQCHCVLKYNK